LESNRLDFINSKGELDGRRDLSGDDFAAFKTWTATYREALGKPAERAESILRDLGQAIYRWLDGDARWLQALAKTPPLIIEFQAIDATADSAIGFLDAPWELLADGNGHLAADPLLLFSPLRRIGDRGEPDNLSEYRLGLTFMAASPRGGDELDFEAEESAILAATSVTGQGIPPDLDLAVEESGNLEVLSQRLAKEGESQVVHLSCHGTNHPEPVLIMEDEAGDADRVDAVRLLGGLHVNMPRLLFLSACQTAAAGTLADSLARTMVRGGAPAVLGWDGSVYDWEATAFASTLYGRLALKRPLELACSEARRALIQTSGRERSRHWHMARLWLGNAGGGPLVGGQLQRSMALAEHGHKEFLDARGQQSPVAGRDMFVGRRRPLQTALKCLRSGERKGVLIHGMGRHGKSSLAARIAHRRKDLEPVVVFGKYDAVEIADRIVAACPAASAVEATTGMEWNAYKTILLRQPEKLEGFLREVLENPCGRLGKDRPILLVIDDFE